MNSLDMHALSWNWIAFEAVVPLLAGLLLAWPLWRRQQPIFGNLLATGVIFGTGVALILREYTTLDRVVRACLDEGMTCFPQPSAFTRFAVYAFVALAEVIAVFLLSIRVEERVRRRGYAPEWR